MKVEWGSDNFLRLRTTFHAERDEPRVESYFLHSAFWAIFLFTPRLAAILFWCSLVEHTVYICHIPYM